jgi:Phage tail protein (Tail_P2_I)
MANLILQPPLQTDLRSQAHLELIDGRLSALDLTPILVYRMASLVDSAVLAMAWQWDVLNPLLIPKIEALSNQNYAAWDQILDIDTLTNLDQLLYQVTTTTEATGEALYNQYRALILLSTSLHSIMGTVGAVKQALTGLGFPGAIIQEGQKTWGGTSWPSDEGWAVFRVLINLASVPAGANLLDIINQMTAAVNYWKPARCWLDSIQWSWFVSDQVAPAPSEVVRNIFVQHDFLPGEPTYPKDVITAPAWPLSDTKTVTPYWNTQYYHSGVTYGQNEPKAVDSVVKVNTNEIAH